MSRVLCLVVVVLGLFPSCVRAQTAQRADIVSDLRSMVASHRENAGTYGLSVAVAFPDGSVFATASGRADATGLASLTPDHQLGFASITKTFVGASILQLVEDGRLSLDTAVRDVMTAPRNVNAGITVRQLLGHQSGLYNYTENPNLQPRLRQDTSKVWTPSEMMAEFVGFPVFFAGTWAAYSNTNYVLLEMIAEAVQTTSLGDHMRQRLFEPLGLNHTFYGPEQRPTGPIPVTWTDLDGRGGLDNFSGYYASTSYLSGRSAAGGIVSTPTDMAVWARAVFGGPVLEPASLDAFLSFHAMEGQNAVWTGYGLGSQQYMISGVEFWGHSGWITGSASLLLYSPEYDVSIAMVDTDTRSQPFTLATTFSTWMTGTTFTGLEDEAPLTTRTDRDAYPNPVVSGSTVVLPLPQGPSGSVRVVFTDLLGRIVLEARLAPDRGDGVAVRLPAGLSSGVVFYAVESGTGRVTGTVLVQH